MDVAVQEPIAVHEPMPEVLPCVEDEHADDELPREHKP